MEMSGQEIIAAPREAVWMALNDADLLKSCIPGCESLTWTSDNEMAATVRFRVGPVSASFAGNVTLSEIVEPESYYLSGKGSGGVAGFAKGGARVRLTETDDGGTCLTYQVDAAIGGKLAQVGQRLIKSTSEILARQFFDNFASHFRTDEDHDLARTQPTLWARIGGFLGGLARQVAALFGAPEPASTANFADITADTAGREAKAISAPAPQTASREVSLTVNDEPVKTDVQSRTLLVELLRENLRLTGTHVGCDTSQCGACTVHVNGEAVKSCSVLALSCDGATVNTIESIAKHPLQDAMIKHQGLQCGFCTPGMIMAGLDIIKRHGADLTDETIRHELEGNICRCTGYHGIVAAIKEAARHA